MKRAITAAFMLLVAAPVHAQTAADSIRVALKDCLSINNGVVQSKTRYLTAYPQAHSYEALKRMEIALMGQIPSVSTGSELTGLKPVAFVKFPGGRQAPWLYRVPTDIYELDLEAFANLNFADVTFHDATFNVEKDSAIPSWLPAKDYQALSALVQTKRFAPIFRADYFIYRTSQQAGSFRDGYADFTSTQTFAKFQKFCTVDEEGAENANADRRAFVTKGEVSIFPRGVAYIDTPNGPYFYTQDFKDSFGRRNIIKFLDKAKSDARMDIGSGRNGLPYWFLGAVSYDPKTGEEIVTAQSTAPDFIAGNNLTWNNDCRVHLGRCALCHQDGGLKAFNNEALEFYGGQKDPTLADKDDKRARRNKIVWLGTIDGRPEMDTLVERAQSRFNQKMKTATGVTFAQWAKAVKGVLKDYEDGVDLEILAREAGYPKDKIVEALYQFDERESGNDPVINALVTGKKIRRELVEEIWNRLMATLQQESQP